MILFIEFPCDKLTQLSQRGVNLELIFS